MKIDVGDKQGRQEPELASYPPATGRGYADCSGSARMDQRPARSLKVPILYVIILLFYSDLRYAKERISTYSKELNGRLVSSFSSKLAFLLGYYVRRETKGSGTSFANAEASSELLIT